MQDLCGTNKKVFIEFKLTENEITLTEPQNSTPTRSLFDVLMSHETHIPPLKLDPKTLNETRDNATLLLVTSNPKSLVFDYDYV